MEIMNKEFTNLLLHRICFILENRSQDGNSIIDVLIDPNFEIQHSVFKRKGWMLMTMSQDSRSTLDEIVDKHLDYFIDEQLK